MKSENVVLLKHCINVLTSVGGDVSNVETLYDMLINAETGRTLMERYRAMSIGGKKETPTDARETLRILEEYYNGHSALYADTSDIRLFVSMLARSGLETVTR